MARTTLTVTQINGAYDGSLTTLTLESAATGGNQFVATGDEFIYAENTDTAASNYTVTIESVADEFGRTQDIVQTVGGQERVMIGPMQLHGFEQTDGNIYLSASNTTVGFSIIKHVPA